MLVGAVNLSNLFILYKERGKKARKELNIIEIPTVLRVMERVAIVGRTPQRMEVDIWRYEYSPTISFT